MPSPPTPRHPNKNLQRPLRYYQKIVLQPEAWFRIVEHDYTQLIAAISWHKIFHKHRADFQLLEIGCGTRRFSTILQPQ